MFDCLSAGTESDLEGIEFPLASLTIKGVVWAGLHPAHRQLIGHANRVSTVLREQQVRPVAVDGGELLKLLHRRRDLHRVEAMKVIDRLNLQDLGPGNPRRVAFPDLLHRSRLSRSPGGVSRVRWRQVDSAGEIPFTGGPVREVIEIILARCRDRLEQQITRLAGDVNPDHIGQPPPGGCIHQDGIYGLRLGISSPPGDMRPNGWRSFGDPQAGAHVAQPLHWPVARPVVQDRLGASAKLCDAQQQSGHQPMIPGDLLHGVDARQVNRAWRGRGVSLIVARLVPNGHEGFKR